jgi:hypothetical protein
MMATQQVQKYTFVVTGTAQKWCCMDCLQGVIADILKAHMPPSDTADLKVEVAEELE